MNGKEGIDRFLVNEAEYIEQNSLKMLTEYYQDNIEALKRGFQQSFLELLDILRHKEIYEPVAYIQCQLLRTSILANENNYLLEARNKELFLTQTKNLAYTYYNASWLYHFYHDATEKIISESKKYLNKISQLDKELLCRKLIELYHPYIIKLAKSSLKEEFVLESLKDIRQEHALEITVGEYMDIYEVVLKIS